MPWVHRGIVALDTGQTDFLLDFGTEEWRDEVAEWTPADLQKILTNFIEEGTGRPIFTLEEVAGVLKISISAKENVGVIMPRGFSKTTLFNSLNYREICFKATDFFLYISEAGAHAERQLGTIKAELENNERAHAVFGKHVPGRQDPLKWTEDFIETTNGVRVGALGRGGKIRGYSKGAKRPKKLVFDDIEDSESVQNDAQRKKDSSWFFGTAMPSKAKGGRITIMGTLLHTDAILNKVIKSARFTAVRFGAIDRQGDALWPFMMSLAQIEELRTAMAEEGELSAFYLEYMSEYVTDDAKLFPETKLIYVPRIAQWQALALAWDPAISEKRKADFRAMALTGIEASGHKHVLDYWDSKNADVDTQLEEFFSIYFRWMKRVDPSRRRAGVESVAFQQALVGQLQGKMFEHSKTHGADAYFEVVPITHGVTAKDARIKGVLKPLIWAGQLSFQAKWPTLHGMMTDFPNGKKDGPDAVAMSVRLLDPFAFLNMPGENADDLTKDTMPPLEKVFGGNFRRAP